jgi:nucleoside-diphosphate-sugar epimerase
MATPEDVVVAGGSGFVGQQICRLGRQAGWDITSLSKTGMPAESDPWVAGIEWWAVDLSRPEILNGASLDADLLIWSIPELSTRRDNIINKVFGSVESFIVLEPGWIDTHETLSYPATIVRYPHTYGPACPPSILQSLVLGASRFFDRRVERSIRVEYLAMAVVRAASEGLGADVLTAEDIERLGRSAMIA